ncbi:MAG TPA: hypothetical protein VLG11_01080 [Candidatus Saccharimonadales bacterium]|nr:hypothetical protein [Candidatus Saccharimonadales bacterium]
MRTLAASETVVRARAFLIETQRPDGSFAATCADGAHAPRRTDIGVVLAHALLLDTLNAAADETLDAVRDRLARWLMQCLTTAKVPADCCVRFQVFAAIGAYRREYITDAMIASAVRHLTQLQTQPGGPYRSTAEPDGSVELATNVAIARFLRLVAQPLPKLDAYILQAASQSLASPYYVQEWPLKQYLHTLFPAYFAKPAADRTTGTALLWHGELICKDARMPAAHACGLAALDAARTLKPVRPKRAAPQTPRKILDEYPAIISAAKREAASLEPPLRTIVCSAIDRVRQSDTRHEIGPLAVRFAAALPSQPAVPAATLHKLGIANLYAWIAYTIYDDFLDDEGKPGLLSAANVALRRSVAAFKQALPDHAAFQTLVAQTFDTIDAANTWEVTHCRFTRDGRNITITALPEYGDMRRLYERSLSHSLPVIGVMAAARIPLDNRAAHAVHKAFKQYLIVRQLSDDLRDWKEDINAGHASPVVTHILNGMQLEPGDYELPALVAGMERQFWQHSLLVICQEIKARVADAQKIIAHAPPILQQNVVGELLDAINGAIDRTMAQHQQAGQFLAAYRQQNV